MRHLDAAALAELLPPADLIEALRAGFRAGCTLPARHHHTISERGEPDATLLLMPAWTEGGYLGVKIATVFPANASRGIGAVQASYMLSSARTGVALVSMDGLELTLRRTAAASALAATYLARREAARLLVVGTGNLAPHLVRAHAAVRPITVVGVWGRDRAKAAAVASRLRGEGWDARPEPELEAAVRCADVVSCATLSEAPLVRGDWLRAGSHLDLVGAFGPRMRECDDEAVRRAEVFVDTRAGARAEAGDLLQALAAGAFAWDQVRADLFELCRERHPGRRTEHEITLFKSVGTALEDLFAAILAWEQTRG
jgi:ornithine cyclodeaminase